MLTHDSDVLGCQRHEFSHHIIPECQVHDAKRPQVYRDSIGQQEPPHKLFDYLAARFFVDKVLALEGYVYVRSVCLPPLLQPVQDSATLSLCSVKVNRNPRPMVHMTDGCSSPMMHWCCYRLFHCKAVCLLVTSIST